MDLPQGALCKNSQNYHLSWLQHFAKVCARPPVKLSRYLVKAQKASNIVNSFKMQRKIPAKNVPTTIFTFEFWPECLNENCGKFSSRNYRKYLRNLCRNLKYPANSLLSLLPVYSVSLSLCSKNEAVRACHRAFEKKLVGLQEEFLPGIVLFALSICCFGVSLTSCVSCCSAVSFNGDLWRVFVLALFHAWNSLKMKNNWVLTLFGSMKSFWNCFWEIELIINLNDGSTFQLK